MSVLDLRERRAVPAGRVLVTAQLATDAKVQHLPRPNPAAGPKAQPAHLATLCGTRRGVSPHWVEVNSFHRASMPMCRRCEQLAAYPEAHPALAMRLDSFLALTQITSTDSMVLELRNVVFVNAGSLVWCEPDYEGIFPYSPVAFPTSAIVAVDHVPARVEEPSPGLRRYRGFWMHPREAKADEAKGAALVAGAREATSVTGQQETAEEVDDEG